MIPDLLLALGLLLSPASQLRPTGSPVGPGELCFALWLALAAIRNFGRTDLVLRLPPRRILAFWLLFFGALCIGSLTTFVMGIRNDPALFKHDIQAYILVSGISFFCVIQPDAAARMRRVAWFLAGLGSAFLTLQLAQAWEIVSIPGIEPWYWDRLRGWSENPNQLALVSIVIGLVSLHLAETATRHSERVLALACAILPFTVGLLTKSDSFLLILATACPILALLKVKKWLQAQETHFSVRSGLAWMGVLALPALLVLAVPATYMAVGKSDEIQREFVQNNRDAIQRDAPERFKLWAQAINVGVSSGMLGLGPGPHLVIEESASIAPDGNNTYIPHPSEHPVPNFESHNTLLDLFTQGGLLAVLAFGWLAVSTVMLSVKARLDSLAILLMGLGVFSVFHLIVRHPLLWFVIALTLVTAASVKRPSPAGKWS